MSKTLRVENLSKSFKNKKEIFKAVDNVSFQINAGEIVSLLGPNGAGKTTIVSMIGSYLTPTSGKIFVNGEDISTKRRPPEMGVGLGGDLGFYGNATINDNLKFYADLGNIPSRVQKSEIARVLSLVELDKVSTKKVNEISKGMKQRLHIARAMLGNPQLLLLDEPTSGLDVEIAQNIRQVITELKEQGTAILLTSHTMEEVASLADKLILLGGGQKHFEGTVEEVIKLSGVSHINREATLEESYLAIAPRLRRKDE